MDPSEDPVRLATVDYPVEIDFDDILELKVGELTLWFALNSDADRLIAFEMNDGEGKTCWNPPPDEHPDVVKITLSFPGRRCSRCLDGEDFAREWRRRTHKYLFPKKLGKMRVEMPLGKDTPLDILADWLQDNEHEKAAQILRQHHVPDEHKLLHKMYDRHVRELWQDYAKHKGAPMNPHTTTVAELLLWSRSQSIKPDELPI